MVINYDPARSYYATQLFNLVIMLTGPLTLGLVFQVQH